MSLKTEVYTDVEIEWGAGTVVYSDNDEGTRLPDLLSVDVVTAQSTASGGGQIRAVRITLDDTSGALKTYYDTELIMGIVASVSQRYTGGVTKVVQLISGPITSDIVWSEGTRTLELSIESSWASDDFGFAPEAGDFANLNPEAVGQVWPACFGTVLKVPAVRVIKPTELTLNEDIDYSTSSFTVTGGATVPQAPTSITLEISRVRFIGTMTGEIFTPTSKNAPMYAGLNILARVASDEDASNPRVCWLSDTINITGLYCLVNDGVHGWLVNKCDRQIGTKCYFEKSWDFGVTLDVGDTFDEVAKYPRTPWGNTFNIESDLSGGTLYTTERDSWHLKRDAKVIYVTSGTPENRYICNAFPSSAVYEVFGYRNYYGNQIFVPIPSSYYTVQLSLSLAGQLVTAIDFSETLEDIMCEEWDGDLYVSLKSTAAPTGNTADVIEYILTNYSDITIDAASFATVHTAIAGFPSHFAYFSTAKAVALCQDIAWQAKCGLVIKDKVAYLTYLADSSGSIGTLTPSIVESKTISLGMTAIEGVITRYTASWFRDYSGRDEAAFTYVSDANIDEYGLVEQSKDWFIYNIEENVQSSVDFWLYRHSNMWKTLSCNVFIDSVEAQVYDLVTLNIPATGINATGVIHYIGYDTGRPIITIQTELAVQAGTVIEDANYWSVGAGSTVDPAAGLAQEDYIVEYDEDNCPDYSWYTPLARDRVHFVFVNPIRKIIRGRPFVLKIEIQDKFGNLVAYNTSAELSLISSDLRGTITENPPQPWVNQKLDITFLAGVWTSGAITVTKGDGGFFFASYHIWVRSKDSRVQAARTGMGAD